MKIFLLEDELQQQLRVEKHIATIANELDLTIEMISTGKLSEFEEYIQHSDLHQLYFLDIHIQGSKLLKKYGKQILMQLLYSLLQNLNLPLLLTVTKYLLWTLLIKI